MEWKEVGILLLHEVAGVEGGDLGCLFFRKAQFEQAALAKGVHFFL